MDFVLGLNIDHVATLRNARNEGYPDVVALALIGKKAGAKQITAHLREDRRHIKDNDIFNLKTLVDLPLNMEMALSEEMIEIALKILPHAVCLVPEKRAEITTEGGLDIISNYDVLDPTIKLLQQNGIKVSIFVDADLKHVDACIKLGVDAIEINTGKYANAQNKAEESAKISHIANYAKQKGIMVHAGHGLNLDNIFEIAKIKEITEFNIGHFLVSYALFVGFEESIQQMIKAIQNAREF
jgi:pyridoxine 5-phosphate synthase